MPYTHRDCPTCGAQRGDTCRTSTGARASSSHHARSTKLAMQQTLSRLQAEERERARARWLEPSRTR